MSHSEAMLIESKSSKVTELEQQRNFLIKHIRAMLKSVTHTDRGVCNPRYYPTFGEYFKRLDLIFNCSANSLIGTQFSKERKSYLLKKISEYVANERIYGRYKIKYKDVVNQFIDYDDLFVLICHNYYVPGLGGSGEQERLIKLANLIYPEISERMYPQTKETLATSET